MEVEPLSGVEVRELAHRGEHLAPADMTVPKFDNEQDEKAYLFRTVGLTARGMACILAQTRNGGVPSKPSRKKALSDLTWRILIVALLAALLSRNGNQVSIGPSGISVTPPPPPAKTNP